MPAVRQSKEKATAAYTVSGEMIREKLNRSKVALWRYVQRGHLPPGRRRPGVYGKWWTVKQANLLLRLVGYTGEPFSN